MPIEFPELEPPLVAVTACANRISLAEHPDIEPHVPAERTEEIALLDEKRYVRLIRERFSDSGNVHFHVDLVMLAPGERVPAETSSIDELRGRLDVLVGKTLFVNFTSRFVIAASELPQVSLVNMLSGLGMKFNNTSAKLSAASVRLDDSVFNEVRWRQANQAGKAHPDNIVDLQGRLGLMPVTPELLTLVIGRATEGLHRFVIPPQRSNQD
jgi:hypothetical protein